MTLVRPLDGPPHLELIERRARTPCSTPPGCTTSACGPTTGWGSPRGSKRSAGQRETVGLTPDGAWGGGLFHRGMGCLRLEVVDIGRSGPLLARYLGGGDYAAPE